MTDALVLRGLSKAFAGRPAVDDLTISVRAGELYALLGPNGAGKTTTLRMVAGLLQPDAGEIRVFGVDARADPAAAKQIIAWAPDEPLLYDRLSPLEYLEFVAGLWGIEAKAARGRAEELLRWLGLWENRGERCEGFSRGMKQKTALAGALIHDPKLLILDEPLTGLDAGVARQVKDLLQARVREGATVILTTHILEVAERMADRIGIIQRGRLRAEGTLDELRARTGETTATLEDLFLELTDEGAGILIGRPGSILWLLAHELRLSLRRFERRRSGGRHPALTLLFTLGLPVLLTGTVGVPVGLALRDLDIQPTPLAAVVAAAVLFATFTLALSQTLSAAVDALYERADLDLLFSSPLNPRAVMTVRFLGVAATVFWVFGYFLAGPIVVIAAIGHPAWLAALVVLFALTLGAAGVGLLLAAVLFRLLGPRRTRTLAQVLAALIGAGVFLIAQARNILGQGGSQNAWGQVAALAANPSIRRPGLDWPLRALLGEPVPLLAAVALAIGVFGIAVLVVGPRFAADAARAAGAGRGGRVAAPKSTAPFADGPFAATLRKELRLLARDPALISQVLLRVLYIVPLGFVLLNNAGRGADYRLPAGAAALSLLAGQVAGSLAWITISAEDAPALLASAPAPAARVRRAKLVAASLPLAVLLAPLILPLIALSPLTGLAAALGCAASTGAAGLINIWWQRPAKRSDFRTRHRGSWFVTWSEFLVGLFISAATGLLAGGVWFLAWLPALVAAAALLLLRRSDAKITDALRLAG